jgi:hypothetical protein
MEKLTREEVLAELMKIGIKTVSDVKSYVKEYEKYCIVCCCKPDKK